MSVYEFGPFHIDADGLLLLHRGEPVALGPKVVETLLALVEHPGEVLAKSALLDRIWPEGFVEEANLAQNIYVLRKTLRAHWDTDAIETVPRRGSRFIAPVRVCERLDVTAPQPAAIEKPRTPLRWFATGVAAAACIAALVLGTGAVRAHRDGPAALSAEGSRDLQIGRYYWNLRTRDGIEKSVAYFREVVDRDPRDARGYAALAEANAMIGDYDYGPAKPKVYLDRARAYAQRALGIDPQSAEAHAALGLIALDASDVNTALAQLRQAIAYDPACGPAHEWYGIALLRRGQLNEGSAQLKIAADLDPLSVATSAWLGSAAYLDHRYGDAIAYSRQALELSPARTEVLTTIGEAYEAEGNLHRAIEAFEQYGRSSADCRGEAAALLAHAFALAHRMDEARAQLAYARSHARRVEPMDLAAAAAAVGERSAAIATLRKMKSAMVWMAVENDPRFDELRSEPAFHKIAQAPA